MGLFYSSDLILSNLTTPNDEASASYWKMSMINSGCRCRWLSRLIDRYIDPNTFHNYVRTFLRMVSLANPDSENPEKFALGSMADRLECGKQIGSKIHDFFMA